MHLWRIFVLAILKQGLNCDFDRLQQYANHHDTVRQMLGHGDWEDDTKYPMQTLVDNISLLSAEKLAEISQLVVEHGHDWVKKSPGDALRGRCDSFVVETDVHYPTDFNLLWDAMRVLIRVMVGACKEYGLPGWRQHGVHLREVRRLFHRVRGRRRQDREERCREYLDNALSIINKADQSYEEIRRFGECKSLEEALADARRQVDQIERRVLLGETIPHQEKVFSIFERHTRWNVKGKAGVPVELGVPVCVLEDQYQFILHHRILWTESDVEMARSMVGEAQARFPDLRLCSFDRNFHSPGEPRGLGRDAGAQRIAEEGPWFGSGPRARDATDVRRCPAAASRGGVVYQQFGASRLGPGAHLRCGGFRANGCVVGGGVQSAPVGIAIAAPRKSAFGTPITSGPSKPFGGRIIGAGFYCKLPTRDVGRLDAA